jgi:hypothetical protein
VIRARAAKPAVQLVALAILVIGVGWSHMSGWMGAEKWVGLAGLTLYACWPLFEVHSLAREAARPATEQDAGTYFTYALARVVTVIVTVFTASSTGIPLWQTAAGVGLLATGIALRTAAIRTLGDQYSNRGSRQRGRLARPLPLAAPPLLYRHAARSSRPGSHAWVADRRCRGVRSLCAGDRQANPGGGAHT